MLPIPTIASTITHLTDARYFAAWLLDAMAFPLDGPAAVRPQSLMQMAEWVEGPELIGRYEHTALDEIQQQWEPLPTDALLLSGTHYLDALAIEKIEIPYYLELPVQVHPGIIEQLSAFAPRGLLLFGDGQDLSHLQAWEELPFQKLLHLRSSSQCQAAWKAVEDQLIDGWVVHGQGEEKVGFKSFDDLDRVYDFLMERAE